ncbi:hypothetical protein FRB94_005130 [Tulasnella sp. JGI-2019a]|nr:hypothetical protein FRB94_005130 [Tulasnella sp. JGI-2019a]
MSTDTQAALNDLVAQYNTKLSKVMPQAVGYNAALYSGISLATILAFNILRPRNKVIYEPKVKYFEGDKKPPPKINDGFFSWVSPLISMKEPELLDKIGLDAVAFLRFLRLMRWLFLGISCLSCAVLLPLDISWNAKNVGSTNRNYLSELTIQNLLDWPLFIHIAMSYIITFAVLGCVWWHWKEMVRLRQSWFRSKEYNNLFYARTLMILRVPKKIASDEGLQRLLQSIHMPYPTTAVHIGRQVGDLPGVIERHNETVRELETILVRFLKGGEPAKTRPYETIGGFMGFGGVKKDAIKLYTNRLKNAEQEVETRRNNIDSSKAENYGFASLASVPYAHIAARLLADKHPKGTTISLAPPPQDLIWSNITKGDAVRAKNRTLGWLLLVLVCFFNTLPLLIISLLANLTALSEYVPFLASWLAIDPFSFSMASGILPPAVSGIFGYALPILMRKISKYQGAITRSSLDRAVVARYYAFLIISQLFIFSLIGVGFKTAVTVEGIVKQNKGMKALLNTLKDLPSNIQVAYLEESSYWLTWFPLRGFLAVFDLAQLINLVVMWIKTRLFGRTPRDLRDWTQPPAFQFAIYFSNMLFMAAVALIYSPLAPLVPVSAAVVFWISSLVYKYQLMFVFVSKVESGGRLWNPVMNRLLFSLLLMHALMTLTIGLKMTWRSWYWVSCLPPALIVVIFKIAVLRRYEQQFRFWIPTSREIAEAKMHNDNKSGKLERRFGHPALHADLFTPMLHAKMMPSLSKVYEGRLGHERTAMAEYDGQKMETQIAPGGIRIAGIEEADLAYNLAQYQRDRGQGQDWDNRSMSSSTVLGSETGMKPHGYDAYMSRGPSKAPAEEFELSNIYHQSRDDITPLLPPQEGFAGQQQYRQQYAHPDAQYSQEGLTAPYYQQHDAGSIYSAYSQGQEVYQAEAYNSGRPNPEMYSQRQPSRQSLSSSYNNGSLS